MPDNSETNKLNANCVCAYECVKQEEVVEKKSWYRGPQPYVRKQVRITLCITLGNLLCGYNIGWSAPIASKLKDPLKTPLDHVLSDAEISWTVSCLVFTSIIGANIGGYLANLIGRKPTLLKASCLTLVGYITEAFAKTLPTLLVARTILGVGTGTIGVLNHVYLGEIASPKIRGSISVMSGILHASGCLLVYCVGPYVPFSGVSYVAIAVNCVFIIGLLCIPESPLYLLVKGKIEEAKLVLHDLGRNKNIDEELQLMVEGFTETLLPLETNENKMKPVFTKRWQELIMEKKNRKTFLITTTLFCIQDSGGVVAVLFYASSIFKDAQSSVDPDVGTIILGLTEVSGVMLSPLLIERCGRRFLLMFSTGCLFLCMATLGTYFYLEVTHFNLIASARWLPLVLLMTCLFSYNAGLGVVPNTLTGEMYSPRLRSTSSSISMTIAWTLCLIVIFNFSNLIVSLGNYGVFWLFAGINGFGFLFTLFVVPETRGKALVEIGLMLEL